MINDDCKFRFRLFLASVDINWRCVYNVPFQNGLVSFYYVRKMPKAKLEKFLHDLKYNVLGMKDTKGVTITEPRTLFLDSGAFSFQNAAGCIAGRSNMDKSELGEYELLMYALDYLEFIKAYGHYFDIIVEVDVDYIIGVKKTKYLFERMREDFPQLRPVWHIPRREEIWESMCKEFNYVGIEGQTRHRDNPISFYNHMTKIAHDKNSRVHAFAMTDFNLLHRVPFDSVDSASWMLQAAMGTVKTPFGTIGISDRSLMTCETGDVLNYATLNTLQRKEFESYVKRYGFTIEQLKKEWKSRSALNTYYYMWVQDVVNKEWDWMNKKKVYQKNLFKV